ncbi:MAG TPA: hypothetical protein VMW03_01860 [Candidatus Krumholzibacteriaceae bacterium]|nr:hypothetical protein [Candidatus Krumholzibacteriaceae bacterium]
MSTQVKSEEELLQYVGKKFNLGQYCKVYQISTKKISPDIDLLKVDQSTRTATGFEFKLLKYHKGWKKTNLVPIYTGLGQTISYLNFGVDQSVLIIGLSHEIPKKDILRLKNKISETITPIKIFRKRSENLESTPFASSLELDFTQSLSALKSGEGCIGVKIWDSTSDELETLLEECCAFPMGNALTHKHNCLIRNEFKYKFMI